VFTDAYDMAVQLMELRERRGMTQIELAAVTGIAQSEISRIERGSANPTEKTLLRIADALGADLRVVERTAQAAHSRTVAATLS
jgi:transcriptional regulator with XRE-family HTH domain